MDEANEARCRLPSTEDSNELPGACPLRAVLTAQGLMDERLEAELNSVWT
jgi:hypothetical protein